MTEKLIKRVLIVCAHRPRRSPSQRYRFEQYLPALQQLGFQFTFLPLLDADDDRLFYSSARHLRKAAILIKTIVRRLRHVRLLRDADIVFIQREASFTGTTFFERRAAASAASVIFDFDDSIWLEDTSPGNKKWSWLKRPSKFFENVGLADYVIAGNEYLAAKALLHNANTVVIPTTVDTDLHAPLPGKRTSEIVTIGWSGSISTVKHFETIIPVLSRLMEEFPGKLRVKIIGAATAYKELPALETVPWTEEDEVNELNTFHIGVMPLPDDEWSRGKCALKGLTYMACAIPAIMSPVGVNTTIIRHGENGFLAATADDWYDCLKRLITDPHLRERLGNSGRETVVEHFSVHANKKKYVDAFQKAMNKKKTISR